MVFNNRSGVENYAYFNVSRYALDQIKSFNIKTTKADGVLAEIDSADVFKYMPALGESGQIVLPIPGIEPGDTLEVNFLFTERIRDPETGTYILPFREIPNLAEIYKISIPNYLHLDIKKNNNHPEPIIETTDSLVTCLFRLENLPGIKYNEYTCPFCELPYVHYTVFANENSLKTYKHIYNQSFNVFTQPMMADRQHASQYKKWKRSVLKNAGDVDKFQTLELLLDDIMQNYVIEPL